MVSGAVTTELYYFVYCSHVREKMGLISKYTF